MYFILFSHSGKQLILFTIFQFHNGSLIVLYMIEGYRKRGHFLLLVELWKAFELPHVSAKYTRVVFFVIVDYIDQPFG